MKQLLIIIFLFILGSTHAQNILISDSSGCRPNDTAVVAIEIDNSKQFISFQFDLQMPDNVTYIGYSLKLSERSTNHMVIGNLVGNNTVRVLAYSPNNSAFLGNAGIVLSFKLAVGGIRGVFPLTITNAIIGDSLSTNILTEIKNGPLSVYPLGICENRDRGTILNFRVVPNPLNETSKIEFLLKNPSGIILSLYDGMGRVTIRESLGEFSEGSHSVILPNGLHSKLISGAMYYIGLETSSQSFTHSAVYQKILK